MTYRNIRLHPVLRFIYLLLRMMGWLGTRVFYRHRLVLGRENVQIDGPVIVVSNHPSTLLDVLNVGIPIRQELFFLANYGLFKHPVSNWLLTRLYCIPIKRRDDVAEGESRNNNAAFKQCFQHLESNGLLFIAAEGYSWMNRWVREFKPGAARIAFGAQERQNWQSDLKILPVGLSYNAPNLFRSRLVVQYGTPIDVSAWQATYEASPEDAVVALTHELQARVTALTIHTRDEAGQQFITQLETILENSNPASPAETFARSQRLTATVLDNSDLRERTAAYFSALQQHHIDDLGMVYQPKTTDWLLLILGFPLFAAGYSCWFLPCYIPYWLAKKMSLYIGYVSNVKVLAGLFTFGSALWIGAHYFGKYTVLPSALFVPLAITLAYFTEKYIDIATAIRAVWKVQQFARTENATFLRLQQARLMINDYHI